jgi:hypothetical protein
LLDSAIPNWIATERIYSASANCQQRIEKELAATVVKTERNLIGKDFPGFFPAPKAIISRMRELAGIEQRHRGLKTSADRGGIFDELLTHHPAVTAT